jgi:phosphohistidine phosphatase
MIFLIRHADAISDEENPVRPLSPKGRDQVARLCGILGKTPFAPAEFWHSPLARSRETAGLLAKGLNLASPLVLKAGIEPEDDPGTLAATLGNEKRDIAVVSHEPLLGILASLMVHGPSHAGVYFPFPKAGVLALSREGKRWRSEWWVRNP